MSRTPGSGWGGGVMLYQKCKLCGRKKVLYDPIPCATYHEPFRCTYCKERFDSKELIKLRYKAQLDKGQK